MEKDILNGEFVCYEPKLDEVTNPILLGSITPQRESVDTVAQPSNCSDPLVRTSEGPPHRGEKYKFIVRAEPAFLLETGSRPQGTVALYS